MAYPRNPTMGEEVDTFGAVQPSLPWFFWRLVAKWRTQFTTSGQFLLILTKRNVYQLLRGRALIRSTPSAIWKSRTRIPRLLATLLDQCASPSIFEHDEAFVRGGDIMVNLVTMHEHFHRALFKRELHLLLLLDCAKGVNLFSHGWEKRLTPF